MYPLIHLSEVHSTNNYLKKILLEDNLEEGTVVYADFQTAGRGQRGNGWESERFKNLTFSMVLYPHMVQANEQFIISQFVSLAIKDVLSFYTDDISIKWPNDIYWQEKKICGILIENVLLGSKIHNSILGIGLNIHQTYFYSDAPNPVSLSQITGDSYDLITILHQIIKRIEYYYTQIQNNSKESIISLYKESLFRKDGYHLYNDGNADFLASIQNIEPSGILELKTDKGELRKFAFKEVRYVL